MTEVAITSFQGRVGDHNNLAIPGANSVANALSAQLGVAVSVVGTPAPACDVLNPGIVPTDYVHENGLSLQDLCEACAVLAESEVIGLEIAEFQNAWEEGGEPVSPAPLIASIAPVLKALQ